MEEVVLLGMRDKEGYLSFWNENLSFVLRGCILIELAFRGNIQVIDDPSRKRFDLSDRLIEVVNPKKTGEFLLDETLQMMKSEESQSISTWIDLLSGETWNIFKINLQLKQVRERISKGLVDKGILRTEMKNFFLFDMATHPVEDLKCKEMIKKRILSVLLPQTAVILADEYFPETVQLRCLRTIALILSAYAGSVLENVASDLDYQKKDDLFVRTSEILDQSSVYPFEFDNKSSTNIATNLNQLVENELSKDKNLNLKLETIAGVFEVFLKMDSIV
ncbi:hypothetical protein Kpol_1062p24 [Vanderwaltozyma polyspora DSM 70294]|uniref:Uncharacterized protein n=1 Tax=Vanderwaltozyma polyspora (strain ATCC 22028 / DSM 70294 / BCRC 21397 / CBS 2163 / NBRC 10782 / NRRL Y-8283 / UCD 57-17) TaxID=436907 RepID=A7TK81_VANPO|nr:uncharacterized protein Kpol_1062p24 [Vanderwaltozyma polyspora DSM 70294]EDO17316.1 hypothetical protein Kpol_1062p24 [Vanderwaltozyma polyspora DSM 70294]